MTVKSVLFLVMTITCTVSGQVLMKKGISVNDAVTLRNIASNYLLLTGSFCYIASFAFWLNVLKLLPLSVAYPTASISYGAVIFASALFLNEQITWHKIIGISFICVGVFFISRSL